MNEKYPSPRYRNTWEDVILDPPKHTESTKPQEVCPCMSTPRAARSLPFPSPKRDDTRSMEPDLHGQFLHKPKKETNMASWKIHHLKMYFLLKICEISSLSY